MLALKPRASYANLDKVQLTIENDVPKICLPSILDLDTITLEHVLRAIAGLFGIVVHHVPRGVTAQTPARYLAFPKTIRTAP